MQQRGLLNSNGRMSLKNDISQKRRKKNDLPGKEVAYRLFIWLSENQPEFFESYFGKYKTIKFEIIEEFRYGDIRITVDGVEYDCEVECRSNENFNGNFYEIGNYKSGVNVPIKHDIKNANGIFISLNEKEVAECISEKNTILKSNPLPKGFIIILTEVIQNSRLENPPMKNGQVDPDNCDKKYKVPHNKTKKYGFDGKKFTVYN